MKIEKAMEILTLEHIGDYKCESIPKEALMMGRNALAMYSEKRIYACYQQNNGGLAHENGALEDLHFYSDKKDVLKWVKDTIDYAVSQGFIIDKESDCSDEAILKSMDDTFEITLFWERQENWYTSFDVIVKGNFIENMGERND